jgi:hypothetical protein
MLLIFYSIFITSWLINLTADLLKFYHLLDSANTEIAVPNVIKAVVIAT